MRSLRHWAVAGLTAAMSLVSACSNPTLTSHYLPSNVRSLPLKGLTYNLPRGLVSISFRQKITTTGGNVAVSEVTASLNPTQMVPDRDARFLALWHENSFADDTFSIELDNGLLKSVNSTAKDETPAISQKLFQIVAAAAQIPAGFGAALIEGGVTKKNVPKACVGDLLIDPFERRSVDDARRFLRHCRLKFEVTFLGSHEADGTDVSEVARECEASVCFRPLVPVKFHIEGGSTTAVSSTFVVAVPDIYAIASYDTRRAACVQRLDGLTFSSGVLTKTELNKPSEVLSCLDIPLTAVQTIAQIPSQLLKVRVDNVTQQANLLQQQNTLLQNQQTLLNTMAATRAAQNPAP